MSRLGVCILIALWVSTEAARACSPREEDLEKAHTYASILEEFAAVFWGRVAGVDTLSRSPLEYAITFEVQRWWKGPGGTEVTIRTGDEAACGFGSSEVGTELLLASHAHEDELSLWILSPSWRIDERRLQAVIDSIGPGWSPDDTYLSAWLGPEKESRPGLIWLLIAGLLTATGVGAGWWLRTTLPPVQKDPSHLE